MFRQWVELLPVFLLRRLALKYCEILPMGPTLRVVEPRPGVFFRYVEKPPEEQLPVCTCGCSVLRHYMNDGMDGCRDCEACNWFTKAEGAPAPKEE